MGLINTITPSSSPHTIIIEGGGGLLPVLQSFYVLKIGTRSLVVEVSFTPAPANRFENPN